MQRKGQKRGVLVPRYAGNKLCLSDNLKLRAFFLFKKHLTGKTGYLSTGHEYATAQPSAAYSRQIGEIDTSNVLKDPDMLKRLNDLNELSDPDKDGILYALDGLLRDAKARKAYGH